MLTRDDVILGFRLFLDRDPDSERTIEIHRRHPSLADFGRALRKSDEFRTRAARERVATGERQRWISCELPSGLSLRVNLFDDGVSAGILRGAWEPAETNFILSVVQPGDSVIDIGAHLGWFTVNLAQALGPDGHVFAFEPRSDIFEQLERSVRDNGFAERCTLHKAALGAEAGERRVGWFPAEKNDGHTFFVPGDAASSADMKSESVRVARLDDVGIERRIRLIKLDVEGGEVDVLRGGAGLIGRDLPIIVSEAFPKWLRRSGKTDIHTFLHALDAFGYRAHYLTDDGIGAEIHFPVTDLESEYALYSIVFLADADRAALLDGKRDARVRDLETQLADAVRANETLRDEAAQAAQRADALAEDVQRLTGELGAATAQTADVERLTRDLADAQAQARAAEQRARAAEWKELEAARRSLRAGGLDPERRANPLSEDLAAAQTLAKQLSTDIDAMRRSTSWRVTKPLRAARRVFGGSPEA